MFARRRAVLATGALTVVAMVMPVLMAAEAAAQTSNASPSDDRARFVGGNATSCEDVGRPPGDVQLKGPGARPASDSFVEGTVDGQRRLQVTITAAGRAAGVVIRAVVVKGSDGHNVYERRAVLPPDLGPPQNYVPPLNGGGNIPVISHWFVCYTLDPPDEGSLRVTKRVERPVGVPVDPLPDRYRVRVTCEEDGQVVRRGRFIFGAGGGVGQNRTELTDIPVGASCRVVELNTGALPEGCEVRYEPSSSREPVVVTVGEDRAEVEVVNDCRGTPVQTVELEIIKVVVGFAPGELPESFVFNVECSYSPPAQVIVPGSGGPGTPRLDDIRVGADCLVSELTTSLPAGTQVTYTINGSPSPIPEAASFTVEGNDTVTVTVTNDASSVPPPGCPSPPVDPTPPGCPRPVPGPPDLSVEERPNLDIDKTARRARVRAGGRMRYTIRVGNRGRGVARGVVVCDRLPRGMTLVSAPGSRLRNGRICWRISRLRPLGSRRFTLTTRANPRASGPTTNVATAEAPRTRTRTARARVLIRPRRPPAVTG